MVITGTMTFTVDGETRTLGPGGTWRIPPNRPHHAVAGPEGAVVIDLFAPLRTDWDERPHLDPRPAAWPGRDRGRRLTGRPPSTTRRTTRRSPAPHRHPGPRGRARGGPRLAAAVRGRDALVAGHRAGRGRRPRAVRRGRDGAAAAPGRSPAPARRRRDLPRRAGRRRRARPGPGRHRPRAVDRRPPGRPAAADLGTTRRARRRPRVGGHGPGRDSAGRGSRGHSRSGRGTSRACGGSRPPAARRGSRSSRRSSRTRARCSTRSRAGRWPSRTCSGATARARCSTRCPATTATTPGAPSGSR